MGSRTSIGGSEGISWVSVIILCMAVVGVASNAACVAILAWKKRSSMFHRLLKVGRDDKVVTLRHRCTQRGVRGDRSGPTLRNFHKTCYYIKPEKGVPSPQKFGKKTHRPFPYTYYMCIYALRI